MKRACLLVMVLACGKPAEHGGAPPQPAHGHGHEGHAHGGGGHDGHAHGHNHRFQNADEWAKKFDDPARDAWQKPKDVVDGMGIELGMTVADVGAGTGYFEPYLSRAAGEKGRVLALDVEPDMVRYLGERAKREGLSNVQSSSCATDDPKLPEAGVDRVLIVDVWHHIEARADYAKKLRAGLKPGGKVFVVDFKLDAKQGPPPAMRLAPEAIIADLAAGGMTAQLAPITLPEQYVVVATAVR